MSERAEDSLVGRALDNRYQVEKILGVGGMGAVYRARHIHLGTPVALKVMRSSEPEAARRFLAEARRTFRLDHPNCVRVTDAGIADGGDLLYLTMELLEGRTLGEELERDGALEAHRVAHIGAQVAAAVHCAHRIGYVHRDLKPDNIMLLHHGGDPDFVKVLDFGLAKLYDEARLENTRSVMSFTQNGLVFGTPHYMSPEQAQGLKLDPRSDLYSLGVVLYEALCGEVPFDDEAQVEVLLGHIQRPPPWLGERCPGLPPRLEELVHQLLAKRPDDRPPSAEAVAGQLEALAASAPQARVPTAVAASETLQLDPAASAELAGAAPPVAERPTALARPPGPETLAAIRPRHRGPLILLALSAVFAAGAVIAWGISRVATPAAGASADAAAVAAPADAAAALPAPTPAAAADAAPTPAAADAAPAPADAAPPAADARPRRPALSASQRRARALLARARAAHNNLQRLSLAHKAFKLDPRNREARFLFAEALVATGDPENRARGCRLLAASRRRARRAGCTD